MKLREGGGALSRDLRGLPSKSRPASNPWMQQMGDKGVFSVRSGPATCLGRLAAELAHEDHTPADPERTGSRRGRFTARPQLVTCSFGGGFEVSPKILDPHGSVHASISPGLRILGGQATLSRGCRHAHTADLEPIPVGLLG